MPNLIQVQSIEMLRQHRWQDPTLTWGLVPTMGALHEGHLSLVKAAREQNDKVGVSIFVNPTQFNNAEDLEKYPRNLERDIELLAQHGVDMVWTPSVADVYPDGHQTSIIVQEVTKPLEGEHRPGHFEGVATIVNILFNVFQPTRAYFGQKDAQQVAVIKRMVKDLAMNLEIVVGPIMREPEGLAMSSRNQRLNKAEREAALVLYRALSMAVAEWEMERRDANHLRSLMTNLIKSEPMAKIDYVSVAHPETLQEIRGEAEAALLSLAVFVGDVRLIDNMVVG